MKTHFDPYLTDDDDIPTQAPCGTVLGDEYDTSSNWDDVTCKLCLRNKTRLIVWVEHTEAIILEQMGDMVRFTKEQESICVADPETTDPLP